MISVRVGLLVFIALVSVAFIAAWWRAAARRRGERMAPTAPQVAIGAVTNFFDTLGIGSFAPTTAVFKALRIVDDERIPGTMIVGHALPVVVQAFIFLVVVNVDPTLLLSMIAATVVGGWLGAGVVTKLPRRPIQLGMGIALISAATFMTLSQLGLAPGGGTALGLPMSRMVFACVVSLLLGGLLMLGIGNYAPTLVLLSLLGMDPRAAFPIMMSAGAMVGMVGGMRFLPTSRFDMRAALGLTLGGIPAVLVAGLIVKELPLGVLRWLVVGVVLYAAVVMLRSAAHERARAQIAPAPAT